MECKVTNDALGQLVEVRLSHRNLITGLAKIVQPSTTKFIRRTFPDLSHLVVWFETDEQHYGERTPGQMLGVSLEASQIKAGQRSELQSVKNELQLLHKHSDSDNPTDYLYPEGFYSVEEVNEILARRSRTIESLLV